LFNHGFNRIGTTIIVHILYLVFILSVTYQR
jgi:hypothetical protein